jgi:hypothetical protein
MTMENKNNTEEEAPQKPSFYKLSAALLPDDLFRKETDVNDWIGCNDNSGGSSSNKNSDKNDANPAWMEITSDPNGFRSGSLGKVIPLDTMVDFERCIGIPMYLIANISPVVVPLATMAWLVFGMRWAKHLAFFVTAYHLGLYAIWRIVLVPIFLKRYHRGQRLADDLDPSDHAHSQYLFTERNVTKYCSMSYVWPETLQRPALTEPNGTNGNKPVIYCLIPHGLVPYGVVGYPYFSKVWNSKLCSWTCAPVLLSIPFVGYYLRAIGYVPAKSKPILEALTKKDRNIGIILDGIDGMFHSRSSGRETEVGVILDRKGICKIALKANVAIVPIYGFGHTGVYDVVVDPFGILQFLSSRLHLSLTPFFGRWKWFMGPPKRDVPITMCMGDPIYPPPQKQQQQSDGTKNEVTQEQIDEHHKKLLDGFAKVFETHKKGYYGETKGAKKKLIFVK